MKDETTSALVATLGGQPQVVTLMLDMLLEQDALIRDVIPIYLPGEDSRSQQGLQKLTRGHAGSISLFPVIPMFPLAAWGLAYMFHRLSFPAGATVLGVIHAVLLVGLLVSIAKSVFELRRARRV